VASRADALRVVEAIELLLEAGQWRAARDLYSARSHNGEAWRHLPAARLGQRAAAAFVATPSRQADCRSHLSPRNLGIYLGAVGLFAMYAGDLATAHEYLSLTVVQLRSAEDQLELVRGLMNLAECTARLGQVSAALDTAAESLTHAQTTGDRPALRNSRALLAWVAGLAGDTAEAERHFAAADQIELADDPDGDHLYSIRGAQWAEWLIRTGRPGQAQALAGRNAQMSRDQGWQDDAARYDRVLGRLALAAGNTTMAGEHFAAAADCFREGDYLTELADVLVDLASTAQARGDLDAAERHVAGAVAITAPRGLVPAQSAALAARAWIWAGQAASPDDLTQGRDAADAALRLATRHQLVWHELDALRAHAALDRAEGADHGWATGANALHARLVPPGLDPDPLATVERLVAEERAAPVAADSQDRSDGGDED
jgi:hypothetical protein